LVSPQIPRQLVARSLSPYRPTRSVILDTTDRGISRISLSAAPVSSSERSFFHVLRLVERDEVDLDLEILDRDVMRRRRPPDDLAEVIGRGRSADR
jgi:hypothetical protein